MKKNHILYILILVLSLGTLFYILINSNQEKDMTFNAHAGNLELDNWNQEDVIDLYGQWLFYPDMLYDDIDKNSSPLVKKVSHWWEEDRELDYNPYGYGTYILSIKGLEPNREYAISIIDVVTAYNLYVNGEKTISNGTVGRSKATSTPKWEQKTTMFKADGKGQVNIAIEVSNFDYYRGGLWNTPELGSVQAILDYQNREKVIEMFLFGVL